MTIEPIEFTYRAYVQFLKRTSFRIESILAVERAELIASILRQHCLGQCPEAFTTMKELGFDKFTDDCWQQAGEMILNNEKIEV